MQVAGHVIAGFRNQKEAPANQKGPRESWESGIRDVLVWCVAQLHGLLAKLPAGFGEENTVKDFTWLGLSISLSFMSLCCGEVLVGFSKLGRPCKFSRSPAVYTLGEAWGLGPRVQRLPETVCTFSGQATCSDWVVDFAKTLWHKKLQSTVKL